MAIPWQESSTTVATIHPRRLTMTVVVGFESRVTGIWVPTAWDVRTANSGEQVLGQLLEMRKAIGWTLITSGTAEATSASKARRLLRKTVRMGGIPRMDQTSLQTTIQTHQM